jgi:hypothetical protein
LYFVNMMVFTKYNSHFMTFNNNLDYSLIVDIILYISGGDVVVVVVL